MEQCINKTEDRGQKEAYNEILAYSRDAFAMQWQKDYSLNSTETSSYSYEKKISVLSGIIHKCKFQKE